MFDFDVVSGPADHAVLEAREQRRQQGRAVVAPPGPADVKTPVVAEPEAPRTEAASGSV